MCVENFNSENEITFISSQLKKYAINSKQSEYNVPLPYAFRPVDNVDYRILSAQCFVSNDELRTFVIKPIVFNLVFFLGVDVITEPYVVSFSGVYSDPTLFQTALLHAIQASILIDSSRDDRSVQIPVRPEDIYVGFEAGKLVVSFSISRNDILVGTNGGEATDFLDVQTNFRKISAIEFNDFVGDEHDIETFMRLCGQHDLKLKKVQFKQETSRLAIPESLDTNDVIEYTNVMAYLLYYEPFTTVSMSSFFRPRYLFLQLNNELNVHEKIDTENVQGFKYFMRIFIKPLPYNPRIWNPIQNMGFNNEQTRIKIPNSVDLSMCKLRFCDEKNQDVYIEEWAFTLKLEKVYEMLNMTDINILPLANKRPRNNWF